jgi:hypothetical protein
VAFTVQDFSDLVRLLSQRPDWQSELRRLLLTNSLLELPEIVRHLVEAHARAEERLARLEAAVERLAEAQARSEERLARLTDTVGELKGDILELRYSRKAAAYFGRWLRRARVVEVNALEETLETRLTDDEYADLLLLDVLVQGRLRALPDQPEVWLAAEVSTVVDRGDVERARRRAAWLRQAGYLVIPVVAGERSTEGAQEEARTRHVVLLQDGQIFFWPEAMQAWTGR